MRLMLLALVCAVFVLMPKMEAGAQTAVSAQPQAQATEAHEIGTLDRVTVWILTQQRKFHHALTERLRNLADSGGNWALAWPLIAASFLYGVFHAAGPGHGKAVVSGYLLSHRQSVRRGIAIAVAGAFVQGLVAIFIVYGLIKLAGLMPRDAQSSILWSERASYALVIAVGAYLLIRAARRLVRRQRHRDADHVHDHTHDHVHDENCGHVHMPSPAQLDNVRDFRSAAAIVLSVGARPCSGAVIVLVFASVVALPWAGIAAVVAMSAGTALTVSALAAFAVAARDMLGRLSGLDGGRAALAADLVAAAGGGLILVLGISLLSAAFSSAHPILGI